MKGVKSILLAFILILAVHGVSLSDGGPGPIPPPPDPRQPPPIATMGAYLKGHFTVAYDKATPNQYTHHNVHAVLEWVMKSGKLKGWLRGRENLYEVTDFRKRMTGITEKTKAGRPLREIHLFSVPIVEPTSKPLCEYSENELKRKYWNLPNQLGVTDAFGVAGANTYLTKLKVMQRDFCGAAGTPLQDEPKAMIYGEVEIFIYK